MVTVPGTYTMRPAVRIGAATFASDRADGLANRGEHTTISHCNLFLDGPHLHMENPRWPQIPQQRDRY
jgi:hypothetical protein